MLTPRTRAIIVVHLAGWPCRHAAHHVLARETASSVIEDCAQAHGAEIGGRPDRQFRRHRRLFVLPGQDHHDGGEGGLLAMDDEAIWKQAWSCKDHGKIYDTASTRRIRPASAGWTRRSAPTSA